jgi:hypothetical protein
MPFLSRTSLFVLATAVCACVTGREPAPVNTASPTSIATVDAGSSGAVTPAGATATGKDCVAMIDDSSSSLAVQGSGPTGWSGYDVTVDLATRGVSGTLSDDREKKVRARAMDADEFAAMFAAFRALCLKSEVAGQSDVGGGCSHYESRERDGSVRLFGHKDCAPAGAAYYSVAAPVARGLAEVFPSPDKKRAPR